jgi:hypothetical protein
MGKLCYSYSTVYEQKEEEDRITEEGAEVVLFSVNVRYPVFSSLTPYLLLLPTWAYMDHLSNGKRELGLRTRRPDTLVCSSCSSLSSEFPGNPFGMLTNSKPGGGGGHTWRGGGGLCLSPSLSWSRKRLDEGEGVDDAGVHWG